MSKSSMVVVLSLEMSLPAGCHRHQLVRVAEADGVPAGTKCITDSYTESYFPPIFVESKLFYPPPTTSSLPALSNFFDTPINNAAKTGNSFAADRYIKKCIFHFIVVVVGIPSGSEALQLQQRRLWRSDDDDEEAIKNIIHEPIRIKHDAR